MDYIYLIKFSLVGLKSSGSSKITLLGAIAGLKGTDSGFRTGFLDRTCLF